MIPSSYPTGRTYQTGTRVVVEAIPAPGYRFIRWSGDIEGTTKSITVQIDRKKSIQAVFARLVPNWLIATIATAIAVPLLLRWRRRRSKYPAQTSPYDSGAL
ncbi:hypothetical protein ACFLVY_01790 [Chloroflexota bacterium]